MNQLRLRYGRYIYIYIYNKQYPENHLDAGGTASYDKRTYIGYPDLCHDKIPGGPHSPHTSPANPYHRHEPKRCNSH